MALSGTISGSTNNQYISARITWTATQDQLANTSSVSATFQVKKSSSSSAATTGEGTWYLTINGVKKTISKSITVSNNNTWVTIGSNTVTVTHDDDGTKSIAISGSGGTKRTTWTTTSCAATVALDAIPRQTIPTFNSGTHYFGDDLEITITPALNTFTHDILYSWNGGTAQTIVSGYSSGQYDWTIPTALMNDIPSATATSALVIIVKTYSGGSLLGTTNTAITVEVPASVVPTISAVTCTDTGTTIPAAWNVFVKKLSTLHVNVTAAGAYSSTIAAYQIEALDLVKSQNNVDVGVIDRSGSVTVSVTVTDTRGRTAQSMATISVVDYELPVIESCVVERTNDRGIPVENGTYLRVTLGCSVSSVSGHNEMTVKIYYKDASDPNVDPTLARTLYTPGVISLQGDVEMISNMDVATTYSIMVEVYDALLAATTPTTIQGVIQSEGAIISWRHGGTGVAFGRTSETAYQADFQWQIRARNGIVSDVPLPVTSGGTGATSLSGVVDGVINELADYIDIGTNGVAVGMQSGGTSQDKRFEVDQDYTSHFYGPVEAMRPQWELLTPSSGFNTFGTGTDPTYGNGKLRIGKIGSHVFMRGSVRKTSTAESATICIIPEKYRPVNYDSVPVTSSASYDWFWFCPCSGANICRINMTDNGELRLEWMRKMSDASVVKAANNWIQLNIDWWINDIDTE